MSIKTKIIKLAIKMTPDVLVIWVANLVMKGIAKLIEFNFDLEQRRLHVKTQLYGEADTIEVWVEDFMIVSDGEKYEFLIVQAHSDRPWLTNILSRIVGKAWKIPHIPQLAPYMPLAAELLEPPVRAEPTATPDDKPAEEAASLLPATEPSKAKDANNQ